MSALVLGSGLCAAQVGGADVTELSSPVYYGGGETPTLHFDPREIKYYHFRAGVSEEGQAISIETAPGELVGRNVHMLVQRGGDVPPSLQDYERIKDLPDESNGNGETPELYWTSGSSERIDIRDPMPLQDFYVMLYNDGDEEVSYQSLRISWDEDAGSEGSGGGIFYVADDQGYKPLWEIDPQKRTFCSKEDGLGCSTGGSVGLGTCGEGELSEYPYLCTEYMTDFRELYDFSDPRICRQVDTGVKEHCDMDEYTISAVAPQEDGDHWGSLGELESFRVFIPPGTTSFNLEVYLRRDDQIFQVARHKQPPDCEFCESCRTPPDGYTYTEVYEDLLPISFESDIVLDEEMASLSAREKDVLTNQDVYQSNMGGHIMISFGFPDENPLSEDRAGWLYIKMVPCRDNYIGVIRISITVDAEKYNEWFSNADWDGSGESSGGDTESGSGTSLPKCECGVNVFDGYKEYCELCKPNGCTDREGPCSSSSDCASGFWCDNGICRSSSSSYSCPVGVGHSEYCNTCGPCNEGEGPCKYNRECKDGLICDQTTHTCERPAEHVCSIDGSGSGTSLPKCECGVNVFDGYKEYCELCKPNGCTKKEGPCSSSSDCASGFVCDRGFCYDSSSPPRYDGHYCGLPLGNSEYCATCGPCNEGEGPCYQIRQCKDGLICDQTTHTCERPAEHVCSIDGSGSGTSLPDCVCGEDLFPGYDDYCDRDMCGPCNLYEGPCKSDAECAGNLVCDHRSGRDFCVTYESANNGWDCPDDTNVPGHPFSPGGHSYCAVCKEGLCFDGEGWCSGSWHCMGSPGNGLFCNLTTHKCDRRDGPGITCQIGGSTSGGSTSGGSSLFHYPVSGGQPFVSCSCSCDTGDGIVEIYEVSVGEENCLAKCAGVCGGRSSCGLLEGDCVECCSTFCESTDNSFSGNEDAIARCKQVCEGKCGFTSGVVDLYGSIKLASIILAALIFAVCGIKFILADDIETKEKSKKCLIYVIAGLIVIGLASHLVNLIYEVPEGAGTGVHSSCVSLIGNAIIECYDKGSSSASESFEYPCRNVNIEGCTGSVTKEDIEEYLDNWGRGDVKSSLVWGDMGVVSSSLGDELCIKVERHSPASGIDVVLTRKSGDELCRSKEQIDMVGPMVMSCWDDNYRKGEDNVYCSRVAKSELESWPADVRVTDHSIYGYLHFHGNGEAGLDFDDDLTNAYGDDACIYYDNTGNSEVFVVKSDEEDICGGVKGDFKMELIEFDDPAMLLGLLDFGFICNSCVEDELDCGVGGFMCDCSGEDWCGIYSATGSFCTVKGFDYGNCGGELTLLEDGKDGYCGVCSGGCEEPVGGVCGDGSSCAAGSYCCRVVNSVADYYLCVEQGFDCGCCGGLDIVSGQSCVRSLAGTVTNHMNNAADVSIAFKYQPDCGGEIDESEPIEDITSRCSEVNQGVYDPAGIHLEAGESFDLACTAAGFPREWTGTHCWRVELNY